MGSGIGKEPRKPQQRVGTGLVMRRWIMTGQNRREGMFGCEHSLANVTQLRFQEIRYTYNSIISMSSIRPERRNRISFNEMVSSILQATTSAEVPINPYMQATILEI